jgi:MFS transporter, DHA1 family, multidrug resistance protein
MVSDLIRESFVGQLVYRLSGRRAFQYAEEKPGFTLSERYTSREKPGPVPSTRPPSESDPAGPRRSEAATLVGEPESNTNDVEKGNKVGRPSHPTNGSEEEPRSEEDEETWRNTVDWYGPDDPECPMNVSDLHSTSNIAGLTWIQWSFAKKCFVSFDIGFITFSIYIGSYVHTGRS